MIRALFTPALLAALAVSVTPALADLERRTSPKSVSETMDALEAAVTAAGASVIARVDHGAAAADAGMELGEAQILIFGDPALGTPVMQQDLRAGLALPLRVLVHADANGRTQVIWTEVDEMFDDMDVDDDSAAVRDLEQAMARLTEAAVAE